MLRIPQKNIHDYFLLEDFQHDFTYILDILKQISKNAKDYGITGDELADDTDKIQELLNERGNIYFPKGTYNLSKLLDVYSNTTITAHPEAIFIRKQAASMIQTATTTETTGYNGERNIRFNGGIYKHNGHLGGGNIFSLFHAEDIIFNDVVFLDTVGAHCIDITGCNNIKVYNCKFKGYIANLENPNKESIQIDVAGCNSYPIYADKNATTYDGTPSCNITVENCVFCKSEDNPPHPVAIGQHGQVKLNGSRYKNIKILNNLMIGDPSWLYAYGIRPISWEGAIISGNVIENYRVSIFGDMFSSVLDSHGNQLKDGTNNPTKEDEDTLFLGNRDIIISNNVFKPAISTAIKPGIWFNIEDALANATTVNSPKHRNITITGNVINLVSPTLKSYGIDFDTTENAIISGNTFINNAKADSIAIGTNLYCNDIFIGDNAYKNITNENIYVVSSTSSNVKAKGKFKLWSGKAYNGKNQLDGSAAASGEIITLSDKISNYDNILVEFYYSGFESRFVDFNNHSTQTVRTLNLADAGNSSVAGINEFVFMKTTETTIELIVNKMQNLATNSVSMNSSAIYISAIYGVNY